MKRPIGRSQAPAGVLLLLLVIALPAGTAAQVASVRVERENFRAAPNGEILAEVVEGAPMTAGALEDGWREATLEGWIWSASVRAEPEGDLDLVVHPPDGENLRASPNGAIIARLRPRMGLEGVDASGSWIRVRRSGWIWEASVEVEEASTQPAREVARTPAGSSPAPAPESQAASGTPARSGTPAAADPTSDAAGSAEVDREDSAPAARSAAGPAVREAGGRRYAAAGRGGIVVLDTPTGDTLATVLPGSSVEVLAEEGDWTRVRVEGWAFTGALGSAADSAGVLTAVTPADVQANPQRYRGRLVEWTVQFIALEKAERFRTDFIEGEPFMLTRGSDDDGGFVYVAVPADQVEAVRALSPLESVRVVGRIRTGRSALTGAPVLDLLELTPQP